MKSPWVNFKELCEVLPENSPEDPITNVNFFCNASLQMQIKYLVT